MRAPTARVRNLLVRLTSGPFDLGTRDEGAFVAASGRSPRVLVDHWAGPMALQLAAVLLLLVLVGPATSAERTAGLVVVGGAFAYAVVLLSIPRLPVLALDLTMPLAAALLVYAGTEAGELRLAVPTLAVVVGTTVFSQRPWVVGVTMTTFLGAGYAVVLARVDHGPAPLSRWIVVMTAVVSSGAFVHWVRSKVLEYLEVEQRVRAQAEADAAELVELSRSKAEFLARMSDQLRTPLDAVLGFTSRLLDREAGSISELQAEYLGDVRTAGLHLVDLVDDVLDVAQVDGRPTLELAPFAVGPTVHDCLRMVRERAERGGVALAALVPPTVPVIQADGRKVRQALLNLVANAVRFTPPGGRVQVSAWAAGDELVVEVRDNGIGIAPEDLERVFDRFEQAPGTGGGTGLGLALARRFVEQHGGRLTAASQPGSGATFTMALPARPTAEPVAAAHVAPARPAAAEADDELYEALLVRGSPANRAMVASLGRTLALGSAGLALVLAVVTPGDAVVRGGIALLAVAALAVVAGLDRFTATASSTGMDLICLFGTVAIGLLVHASGSFRDVTPLAYGWLICVAFAPWAGRHRYLELLMVGIGYAVVLAADAGPGSEVDRWIAVVGVFLVNGFVIRALVTKLQLLMFAGREARRHAEAVEEELELATAHKDDFVASMSHELRTPLNAIVGFSEVIQSGGAGPLEPRQAGYVDAVLAAGRQLLHLIDDILELAKLDAGRVGLELDDVAVADVLERAAAIHTLTGAARGVDVLVDAPMGLLPARADRALLERAVTRLLGCAVAASADGSPVLVRARSTPEGVVVDIDDRSAAAPALTWDERDGGGLAVVLARRAVALQGGSVAVEATATGNRCRLTLPAAAAVGAGAAR